MDVASRAGIDLNLTQLKNEHVSANLRSNMGRRWPIPSGSGVCQGSLTGKLSVHHEYSLLGTHKPI